MTNYARRELNRFPPKSSIEWLDRGQKANYRRTIKVLTDLALAVEKGKELTPEQEAQVSAITKSDAIDTRINFLWNAVEQTSHGYQMKLAGMAPHDLASFHELMNPQEPPSHHHYFMCDHLMQVEAGEIAVLIMAFPPGAAKSTYASRSFAQWMIGRHPNWPILALGHTQRFTEEQFSKPIKNNIDTDTYRLAFPDVLLAENERGASFWRLEDWKGSYACRGALAATAGLRARLAIGDDLFPNAAAAASEVERENIWRWWTADVMTRMLPGSPMVLVNTLWHTDDVPNRLKRMNEENPAALPQPFVFINIPAQAEEDDPLGRRPGEWLWCKDQQDDGFYSILDYETKRNALPPSHWSALYLGKPLDQMGDYISEDQFTRYERPPINRVGYEPEWVKTVISVDSASKGKERSDYTVILVFRVRVDGVHCLVDVWRDKKPLETVIRTLARLMRHWQANHAIVEDTGMGAQILENYQGKMPCPMVPYTPSGRGSKDYRFDAAAPWITSGRVQFPQKAPWLTDFINELVAFPNGSYDDQVDAFSQYTDCEVKTKIGGTKKLKMVH
jgi:predicted phage terminase large subunit-like protein